MVKSINIKVEGVDELLSYLNNLPKKLENGMDNFGSGFIKSIKKSAKLRAPRDTGRMARSINIINGPKGKKTQNILEVGSNYAIYQEFGFRPHIFLSDPGRAGFATNKLPLGQALMVSKWTPFIQPAITHNLLKLNIDLSNKIDKAIQ